MIIVDIEKYHDLLWIYTHQSLSSYGTVYNYPQKQSTSTCSIINFGQCSDPVAVPLYYHLLIPHTTSPLAGLYTHMVASVWLQFLYLQVECGGRWDYAYEYITLTVHTN